MLNPNPWGPIVALRVIWCWTPPQTWFCKNEISDTLSWSFEWAVTQHRITQVAHRTFLAHLVSPGCSSISLPRWILRSLEWRKAQFHMIQVACVVVADHLCNPQHIYRLPRHTSIASRFTFPDHLSNSRWSSRSFKRTAAYLQAAQVAPRHE